MKKIIKKFIGSIACNSNACTHRCNGDNIKCGNCIYS